MPDEPEHARRHSWRELDRSHPLVIRVDAELGDQTDSGAHGNQAVHGLALIGAEHVARLESARAKLRIQMFTDPTRSSADEGKLGDLAQRERCSASSERRVGRNEQYPRVTHQLDHLERPIGQRLNGEADVEVTALDAREQLVLGDRFRQLDLDVRPFDPEAAKELRKDPGAGALQDAQPKPPSPSLESRGYVRLSGLQPRDDRLSVAEDEPTRVAEVNGAGTAGPLDQLCA